MSTSCVVMGAPWITAAPPPIRMNLTPPSNSAARSPASSLSSTGTTKTLQLSTHARRAIETLSRRQPGEPVQQVAVYLVGSQHQIRVDGAYALQQSVQILSRHNPRLADLSETARLRRRHLQGPHGPGRREYRASASVLVPEASAPATEAAAPRLVMVKPATVVGGHLACGIGGRPEFTAGVTASRWRGLQQLRILHKWSKSKPSGTAPTKCSNATRWVMRRLPAKE